MMKIPSLILATATFTFSNFSLSQEFLGGVEVGMSPQEVVRTVEGAKMFENGSFLSNGATELVRNKDYEVVGETFIQNFYFIDNRLDQITLNLKRERSFVDTLFVFEALVQALRAKYGNEINHTVRRRGVFKKAEADWFTENGVNIGIYSTAVEGYNAMLNVNYQARISESVDKL
ncbi:hypothetical protein K7H08_09580 [Halomonas sp. IOP_6]|uniref:hypothetical protein n=1 Tax=Halomonas sp. IOP_6 TaxID=2876583 RepID=UPI001E64017D|nr:hypothetical protein [Halomonas sp. IOP_6]MCD6005081.1 hypothetical protein [Halomonas sp. IOP_6]